MQRVTSRVGPAESTLRSGSVAGTKEPKIARHSRHAKIETAVSATKLGAHDFVEKPLSTDSLLIALADGRSVAERKDSRLPTPPIREIRRTVAPTRRAWPVGPIVSLSVEAANTMRRAPRAKTIQG